MSAVLKVEIDGQTVEVAPGTMVMEAANRLGIYVPHFCYHKKLSIAANCRMCLVDIEKAPKPMPACATPVTDGMKVQTHSARAKQAQNGVMEFLLINHPLDCPICDQGGECLLQDLAVGYGGSSSRYDEPKRVVHSKDIGPLVAAEEMSRCIQCTRCVRFGQEVAGVMELGMINRGEHSEIVSFVGRSVESELSGNMIDICPVGALTSKPFRYAARGWELVRRKTISPHDSHGTNLICQVKLNRVMRVLPLENEEVNECWISDRDRFSYEGLNAPERLKRPLLREGETWRETDWETALGHAVAGLTRVRDAHGPEALGAFAAPNSTLEEFYLLQQLLRGLGSDNLDFRLRRADLRADAVRQGAPWLGMKISELAGLDRVLVVGSFLRKDHPLMALRLRQGAGRGHKISLLHVCEDDPLFALAGRSIVAPSRLVSALAGVVRALAEATGQAVPAPAAGALVDEPARALARQLTGGERPAVLFGNTALAHPEASGLQVLGLALADLMGGRFGFLGESGNSIGGHLAGALPRSGGRDALAMQDAPPRGLLLVNVNPGLDFYDPARASRAVGEAEFVVSLSCYAPGPGERADVVLPVAPFTEAPGTYVSAEGRLQRVNAVVAPLGECRPVWKVLRVLGSLFELPGFDYNTNDDVFGRIQNLERLGTLLDNRLAPAFAGAPVSGAAPRGHALERIADVPIFSSDAIVRHAASLQHTVHAATPQLRASAQTLAGLGLSGAARARVITGGEGSEGPVLDLAVDEGVPEGCVRLATAHPATAALGGMFGPIEIRGA